MTDESTWKVNWERLYYPGTNTFVNFFGERDGQVLKALEGRISSAVAREISAKGSPGDFSLEHMRNIHRDLFKTIYPWAGEVREFALNKRNPDTSQVTRFSTPEGIKELTPVLLQRAQEVLAVREQDFTRRPQEVQKQFTSRLADVYQVANQMHPFREGNGRVHKIWLAEMAKQAGWELDFTKIEPRAWNYAASISAEGVLGQAVIPGRADKLRQVFEHIATHKKALHNPYIQGKLGDYRTKERVLEIGELSPMQIGIRHNL